jgi:hypothetical protein
MDASEFAMAYGLSTSIGLRAFLTLAVSSIAIHYGLFHLSPKFAWLGSTTTMWVLIVLAIAEFFSDKIPVVDNLMHGLYTAIKPISAAILAGAALPYASDTEMYIAMGLAALNAFGVHTAATGIRAVSTTTTLGVANPIVSVVEDGVAAIGIVLSVFAPFVAAAFAIVITIAIVWLARRIYLMLRSRQGTVPANV